MRSRTASLIAVLAAAAWPALAQSTGGISGTVIDPSGGAIPGAAVEAYLAGGARAVLAGETTSEGLFRLAGVQPGLYDLTVQAPGFQRKAVRGVKVDPARETALPFISSIRLQLDGGVSSGVSEPLFAPPCAIGRPWAASREDARCVSTRSDRARLRDGRVFARRSRRCAARTTCCAARRRCRRMR